MFNNRPFGLRLAIATAVIWAIAAMAGWFIGDTAVSLVGAKPPSAQRLDAGILVRPDLSKDQMLLEKTLVWGMQRDGLATLPKVAASAAEIKIVWSVAATVVRRNERYLLIIDQGSKAITRVNEGEKLPDGSKLLKVDLKSYLVRMTDGKRRTVETRF